MLYFTSLNSFFSCLEISLIMNSLLSETTSPEDDSFLFFLTKSNYHFPFLFPLNAQYLFFIIMKNIFSVSLSPETTILELVRLRFSMAQNRTTQSWAESWVYNLGGDKPGVWTKPLPFGVKESWKSCLKKKALIWTEPFWNVLGTQSALQVRSFFSNNNVKMFSLLNILYFRNESCLEF